MLAWPTQLPVCPDIRDSGRKLRLLPTGQPNIITEVASDAVDQPKVRVAT